MVRLVGIALGLWIGWSLSDDPPSFLLLAFIIIIGLTIRNLVVGIGRWMRDPARVDTEALASAMGDPDEFERVAHDVDEMRRLGRPTFRVIFRYIAVCFALNFITVSLSVTAGLVSGCY